MCPYVSNQQSLICNQVSLSSYTPEIFDLQVFAISIRTIILENFEIQG